MMWRLTKEPLEGSLAIARYRLSHWRHELGCVAVSRYVWHRARLRRLDCHVGLHHGVAHLLSQRDKIARRVRETQDDPPCEHNDNYPYDHASLPMMYPPVLPLSAH